MTAPRRVGVVGGGRMGAGIAHAFLLAGSEVVVVERDDETAITARDRIAGYVASSIERRDVAAERRAGAPGADGILARLAVVTDVAELAGADLAIEAVPEDRAVKRDALARMAAAAPGAVLASNTSSIPIGDLAGGLPDPSRLVGLHFFNPVPSSRLVEVVVAPRTTPDVVELAREAVAAIGKAPIEVRDSPGFASSRLGVALGLEAIRMVEEGVASAGDIDAAMELGYRHAMGPLRTTDIVGLDVRLAIAEELHRELGDRFAPPDLLRRLVAEGHLGRKTGRGFYEWSD